MRFLLLGDVVGKAGREEVVRELPRLRHELALDFTAVNGENAAHGFGITPQICAELYAAGADVITTGNHVWDRKEIIPYIGGDPRLLRPLNFPSGTPGKGAGVFALKDGRKLVVVNAMARLFMDTLDDPFAAVERAPGRASPGRGDSDPARFPRRGDVGKDGDGLFLRRPRLRRARHPLPRAHRRSPHPAQGHGLHDRCRHVRRLRFGHRHAGRKPRSPASPRRCRASGCCRPRARRRCAACWSRPTTRPAWRCESRRCAWAAGSIRLGRASGFRPERCPLGQPSRRNAAILRG